MALLSDIAKTAVPVLGPTIGLANAALQSLKNLDKQEIP